VIHRLCALKAPLSLPTRIITCVVLFSGIPPAAFLLRPFRGRTRVSAMPYLGCTLLENDQAMWIPQRRSIADCNPITSPAKMVQKQSKRMELARTKHGPRRKADTVCRLFIVSYTTLTLCSSPGLPESNLAPVPLQTSRTPARAMRRVLAY